MNDQAGNRTEEIRKRALQRATGQEYVGERGGEITTSLSRDPWPSVKRRRARTVAAVLPSDEDMARLKTSAERLKKEFHKPVTATSLASLLLKLALDMWERGEIQVSVGTSAIEHLELHPVIKGKK